MVNKTETTKDRMQILNWMQVDVALEKFAHLEAELMQQDSFYQIARQELLAKFQVRVRADLEKRELLASALKKFAQANKSEFNPSPQGDGRSYEHAGAVLGFRQSPGRVEIRNEDKIIEWLRDCRNGRFVRLIHEPNREALLEVLRPSPDADQRLIETLAAHGITFQQKDKFFLEVTAER